MKPFLLIIIIQLLSFNNLDAQSIIWANQTDELYRCAENKLLIDISGYTYNELTLVPDTGEIDGGDGQYAYSTDALVNQVTFSIYHKGNLVAQKSYDLYYYPYPVGYICNRCPDSWIYKSEILQFPEIKVVSGNGPSFKEYQVVGFDIIGAWEEVFRHNPSRSGFFTPGMMDIIQSLGRSATSYIIDLQYLDDYGIIQKVPGFFIH